MFLGARQDAGIRDSDPMKQDCVLLLCVIASLHVPTFCIRNTMCGHWDTLYFVKLRYERFHAIPLVPSSS